MKKLKIFILLLFLYNGKIYPQNEIDTLQLFPDSTTFTNNAGVWTEWISNWGIKLKTDSTLGNFSIEKILVLFIKPGDTIHTITPQLDISTGSVPGETKLYSQKTTIDKTFPNWMTINLDPPLTIENQKSIFITGDIFFFMAISYTNNDTLYKNQYYYYWEPEIWNEGIPFYFPIKVVVRRLPADVKDGIHIINEFKLFQNYPNPFNPTTNITYSIPQSPLCSNGVPLGRGVRGVFVSLKVYDILGREITTLVNEEKKPGIYTAAFNATKYNLTSGIYLYRLTANSLETGEQFIKSAKMMLIK